MELGKLNQKGKIYFYSAKNLLASSFLFPLSCFASGQALIHLGVQGRLDEKKRSKEKSSQQKTAPRSAGRRLVLWQPHALLAIAVL
jgi:hypothetical protein